MKAYKAFDKNMQCRGFQYAEGHTYEAPEAVLCEKGFHACTMPLDVLGYYAPGLGSIYREVDLNDVSEEQSNDSTPDQGGSDQQAGHNDGCKAGNRGNASR